MLDARRLLDQVMGAAQAGGLDRMARSATQGVQRATQGADRAQLLTGAVAGGLVGLLLGNRGARRMLGKGAGTALKLGGLAAGGALAYTAWQRHKAGSTADIQPAPAGGAFLPPPDAADGQVLARGVLVAMIQGAKADGHIDAEEQRRIFGHLDTLNLDAEGKAFVMDEMAAPLDVQRIARHATTPESATELYAAALLAMDPDAPSERAFLTDLARALRLDPGLAAEVERTVHDAR